MPIQRSVQAYRTATPIEQALWTLAAIPLAVAVPAALQWILRGIAHAGWGQAGYAAAQARAAVLAAEALVHWVAAGVLVVLTATCAVMAIAYLKDAGRSRGIPAWAVAQAYGLGAAAALGGLLWLL
jgi:hypothetical protein